MATDPNNTVYIERNFNIQNITHLQQYEYLGKIIYVMGETHNVVSVSCPSNPITVAEYVTIALLTNDKSNVLAEHTSYNKLKGVISSNIISMYDTIKSSSLISEERYKYVEYRPYFLQGRVLTYLFYASDDKIGQNSYENIIKYFVNPFFDKQELFNYESNLFSNLQENVKQGIKAVKREIYNEFTSIKRQLEIRQTFEENFESTKNIINDTITNKTVETDIFQTKLSFINRLRSLWIRVNDSLILPYLFDTNQTETFLLIGSHHSVNLMNILLNFKQRFNIPINMLRNYENPEGCIKILQPIPLYGENIRSNLVELEAIENKDDYTEYEKEIIKLLRTME